MPEHRPRPEHLIKSHLVGGEIPKKEGVTDESAKSRQEKARAGYETRASALDAAPDLPADERLVAVEEFQRLVHETQDLRIAVKHATSLKERTLAAKLYAEGQKKIELFLKPATGSLYTIQKTKFGGVKSLPFAY